MAKSKNTNDNTAISALKSKSTTHLQALNDQISKWNSRPSKDDRFWYPDVDKAGNGSAIIRFLPAPEGEDVPFVRVFSHAFEGTGGGWYIENDLSTIGKQDPCSEYNQKLWNSTQDDDAPARKQARVQKRNQNFIANIFVVKDSQHPENDGKVKLFKFGKKIFEKVTAVLDGSEEEGSLDPFNLWDGANFLIKTKTVKKYRNYDDSKFLDKKPLFDKDDDIELTWKQAHSLQKFVAPDQFKSYDELKERLNKVLGLSSSGSKPDLPKMVQSTPPWEDSATSNDADSEDAFLNKLLNSEA